MAHAAGEYEVAQSRYGESLRMAREAGNLGIMAWSPYNLGLLALDQGDYSVARSWLEESVVTWQELGEKPWIVYAVAAFSSLAAAEGQLDRSLSLAGAVDALSASVGVSLQPAYRGRFERWRDAAQQMLEREAAEAALAAGRAMTPEEAVAYALAKEPARAFVS